MTCNIGAAAVPLSGAGLPKGSVPGVPSVLATGKGRGFTPPQRSASRVLLSLKASRWERWDFADLLLDDSFEEERGEMAIIFC